MAPSRIAVDSSSGGMFVADTDNKSIRFVTALGDVTLYAIDESGERQAGIGLAAFESIEQPTFQSWPWVVEDATGAIEVFAGERRIAIAGPGELVGYLAILEGKAHGASARVREEACLLEMKAGRFLELYNGSSGTAVSLQHAIHLSLLRALGSNPVQDGLFIAGSQHGIPMQGHVTQGRHGAVQRVVPLQVGQRIAHLPVFR